MSSRSLLTQQNNSGERDSNHVPSHSGLSTPFRSEIAELEPNTDYFNYSNKRQENFTDKNDLFKLETLTKRVKNNILNDVNPNMPSQPATNSFNRIKRSLVQTKSNKEDTIQMDHFDMDKNQDLPL